MLTSIRSHMLFFMCAVVKQLDPAPLLDYEWAVVCCSRLKFMEWTQSQDGSCLSLLNLNLFEGPRLCCRMVNLCKEKCWKPNILKPLYISEWREVILTWHFGGRLLGECTQGSGGMHESSHCRAWPLLLVPVQRASTSGGRNKNKKKKTALMVLSSSICNGGKTGSCSSLHPCTIPGWKLVSEMTSSLCSCAACLS